MTIEAREQLLLIHCDDVAVWAGKIECSCAHGEILANWLGIAMYIKNTYRPESILVAKIFATEVEERDPVTHRCLHITDQSQNVSDGYLGGVPRIETTAFEAASTFYHPEVLT